MSENETHDERQLRLALANAIQDVATEVAEPIAVLKKRARTMRIVIWTLIWLKVLTTSTIVVLFLTLNTVENNQNEIKQIQDRTNNEVLCPLYNLFEQSAKLPAPPHYTEAQKQQRLDMFKEIARSSEKLECPNGDAR